MDSSNKILKDFIRESIKGVYYLGLKKSSLDGLKKTCPNLYGYLSNNYQEFLSGCTVAVKDAGKALRPVPYVLLPDGLMTVISWDFAADLPIYSQSEDLARSIERFA